MPVETNTPSGSGLADCFCCHAEENSIVQAAYHGISTKDSTIYVTLSPCLLCAKMIINAGIRRIMYREGYPDEFSLRLLNEAGVTLERFEPEA